MSSLQPVLDQIKKDSQPALDRLFEFLRIESISTDPAYASHCVDAADWLVKDLQSFGVTAQRHDTPGHPMVTGHTKSEGAANVLFYGHYDVQPVDPLELWNQPPFEPVIENTPAGDVIRARGAADDKGQLMTFVEACRSWHAVHGKLPANITFLFEGEEESGSPSLVPFLRQHANQLRADLALVCDTGMWDADTPAICTMLRGLLGEELTITAADKDLHSGMYGGPARNPIRVLTSILAGLHDQDGRVTVPGFYDGVHPLPAQIAEQWKGLGFNADEFLGGVDLSVLAGEKDYSALEQLWSRPTCEINGIVGGYTGEGFKTVLPSKASAKVSFRLVGDQDPHLIRKNFRDYVQQHLPADCTVEYEEHGASPGTVLPLEDPAFEKSRIALSQEWENEAVYAGCGGSIPIVGYFQEYLGMDSLLVGFGLDDDQIHSPNEKYSLKSFQKGIRSWARVLDSLTS